MAVLSVNTKIHSHPRSTIIFLAEKCVLLHKGVVALCRQRDNLVYGYYSAPMIFGLNLSNLNPDLYIRPCGNIQCEIIEHSEVIKLADEHKIWKSIALFSMKMTSQALHYHNRLTATSTRELIIACLMALETEDDIVRSRIVAVDYIQSRTNLSRSAVMKLLAELKSYGGVTISKGLLVSLDKAVLDTI